MVWHYLSKRVGYAEAKFALVRHWCAALQAQQDGLFALSDSAILDDASRDRIPGDRCCGSGWR
jgi:hypothetical protein